MWVKSTCPWIHTATTSWRRSLEIHFKFFEIKICLHHLCLSFFPLTQAMYLHSLLLFSFKFVASASQHVGVYFLFPRLKFCVCRYVGAWACVCEYRADLPGTEVTGSWEPPYVGTGNQAQIPSKVVHALNSWAVSPLYL